MSCLQEPTYQERYARQQATLALQQTYVAAGQAETAARFARQEAGWAMMSDEAKQMAFDLARALNHGWGSAFGTTDYEMDEATGLFLSVYGSSRPAWLTTATLAEISEATPEGALGKGIDGPALTERIVDGRPAPVIIHVTGTGRLEVQIWNCHRKCVYPLGMRGAEPIGDPRATDTRVTLCQVTVRRPNGAWAQVTVSPYQLISAPEASSPTSYPAGPEDSGWRSEHALAWMDALKALLPTWPDSDIPAFPGRLDPVPTVPADYNPAREAERLRSAGISWGVAQSELLNYVDPDYRRENPNAAACWTAQLLREAGY